MRNLLEGPEERVAGQSPTAPGSRRRRRRSAAQSARLLLRAPAALGRGAVTFLQHVLGARLERADRDVDEAAEAPAARRRAPGRTGRRGSGASTRSRSKNSSTISSSKVTNLLQAPLTRATAVGGNSAERSSSRLNGSEASLSTAQSARLMFMMPVSPSLMPAAPWGGPSATGVLARAA